MPPGSGRRHGGVVTSRALGEPQPAARALVASPTRRRLGSRATTELALVVTLYVGYSLSRLLADGSLGPAVTRAGDVLGVEGALGLDRERQVNRWFAEVDLLGLFGSYWYATAHYLVTAVVLVWLYRRSATDYRAARSALVLATVLALCFYLVLPTAPPRLTGDYVDVLHLHSAQGWWGADASAPRGLGGLTNELAALPSLHAGWALWVALVLRQHAPRPWRLLGGAHAWVTAVVVVGTGNHWVLDVVGGWAVVALGMLVVQLASTGSFRPGTVHRPTASGGGGGPRLRG